MRTSPLPLPAGDARSFTPAHHSKTPAKNPSKFSLEKTKIHEATGKDFWTNPNGRLQVGARTSEIRDKSIKALGFYVEGVNALIHDDGLHKFGECIKTARNVFAIWNIFIGVIPGLYWGLKNMYRILTMDEPATYNVLIKETRKHTGVAQKILAFISEVGYFVGALTYTIGFGLCSPIKLISNCWKDKVNANAKAIGDTFGLIMVANHVGVALANICDLIREKLVLDNFVGSAKEQEKASETFYRSTLPRISLNLGEKLCETGVDVVTSLKVSAPAGVKVILSMIGGTLGFYRVWREIEGSNTLDPVDEIYGPGSDIAYGMRAAAG